MSGPMVEVRDLEVELGGRTVLAIPGLKVHRGESLSLVGRNGSGKSTLLRVLGLTLRPTRGEVYFDGERVRYRERELLRLRRRMASVLQSPLLCRMTVFSNVSLGLRFRGLPRAEIDRRVRDWLERLQIGELAGRREVGLSGGEAQRASLARALALEPEVLLLDEPFAALDPPTRDGLLAEFRAIQRERKMTTVFATHRRGEALALGDRVAVLLDGELAQLGSPWEVFDRPRTIGVARFVGADNLLRCRVVGQGDGIVELAFGERKLRVAGSVHGREAVLCVRPDRIRLVANGSAPDQGNELSGRVMQILPGDVAVRVRVDCGEPVIVLVPRSRAGDLGLGEGQTVRLVVPVDGTHLIEA